MNEKFNENLGFIKAMWCGDEACEEEIKAQTGGATSQMYPGGRRTAFRCMYTAAANLKKW